jgi:hypothetical protein
MPEEPDSNLVVVTIPVYKTCPDENERRSLVQCLRVLNRYPIVFFAPEGLNMSFYERACADIATFRIQRFDAHFFAGIGGYNELMLSRRFYQAFRNYRFLLIYQLDAWVFRDELENWCHKGYDYIGAPYPFINMDTYPMKVLTRYRHWLKRMQSSFPGFYQFKQVGNGGFSLRNVRKVLFLLRFKNLQPALWQQLMEDNYFQYWGNLMFPFFKLPPVEEAAKFSIELEPGRTYQLTGGQLPFGCHAYLRYEPEFWKCHIPLG